MSLAIFKFISYFTPLTFTLDLARYCVRDAGLLAHVQRIGDTVTLVPTNRSSVSLPSRFCHTLSRSVVVLLLLHIHIPAHIPIAHFSMLSSFHPAYVPHHDSQRLSPRSSTPLTTIPDIHTLRQLMSDVTIDHYYMLI